MTDGSPRTATHPDTAGGGGPVGTGPAAGGSAGASPGRSRRLGWARHRAGRRADIAVPADAVVREQPAEGVTVIDLTVFEQAVRDTPPTGFPALHTPARGLSLPVPDGDCWAGTLLPQEAEPFRLDALRSPAPGERWALDAAASLPDSQTQPEVEPIALMVARQTAPLIPLDPPAAIPPAATPPAATPPAATPPAATSPAATPAGLTPAPPAPTATAAVKPPPPVATPAGGLPSRSAGHAVLARLLVGAGACAGAAVALGAAVMIAGAAGPAESGTSPAPSAPVQISEPAPLQSP